MLPRPNFAKRGSRGEARGSKFQRAAAHNRRPAKALPFRSLPQIDHRFDSLRSADFARQCDVARFDFSGYITGNIPGDQPWEARSAVQFKTIALASVRRALCASRCLAVTPIATSSAHSPNVLPRTRPKPRGSVLPSARVWPVTNLGKAASSPRCAVQCARIACSTREKRACSGCG